MAHVVIIGAGMSGMSLAWYLSGFRKDWQITVLEAENRAGGKAWTEKRDGFLVERGVNGVLDNKPATLQLASELGLSPLRSRDASRKRFIVRDGRLAELPDSAGAFLSSGVLSLDGKLGVMREPFVPRGNMEVDESLASFAVRRLGKEAYRYLIDPMASGIYAGNPERLSLKSCFPRIHELERDYGSLIRAMIRLQAAARKRKQKGPKAGPGGVLTSFRNGMSELVDKIRNALGERVQTGCRVETSEPSGVGWKVNLENGKSIEATHLVVSCPSYAARDIFKHSLPDFSEICRHIEYPPIAIVAFGISKGALSDDLNGFGFLCPFVEKREILGALWDSSVFDNRAPVAYHLVRCLMGGMRNRHCLMKTDRQLQDAAFNELRQLCGIRKPPEFSEVFRWTRAIPQYHIGHSRLLESLKKVLWANPGLFVRCNWIGGVSLNDCILNSRNLAAEMASENLKSGF